MTDQTKRVMDALGYTFHDEALLRRALTHPSAGKEDNQRLEFLGDAVLQYLMSDRLYRNHPSDREGSLTHMRALLVCEAAVGFVALLIVELFPRQLIAIFGAGNESAYYTAFAVRCFRIYLCMMVPAMINKGTFIYLQALGKAGPSMLLSMVREIIFGVFLPILLPRFFGLDGVLYSFPTADILTFLLTLVVILKVYRELSTENSFDPLMAPAKA